MVESVYSAVRTDSLYNADYVLAFNRLNAELNPTCHLLTLLGAHHTFHASGLRVKRLRPSEVCLSYRLDNRFMFRVSVRARYFDVITSVGSGDIQEQS